LIIPEAVTSTADPTCAIQARVGLKEESHMRKVILKPIPIFAAAVVVLAGASLVAFLPSRDAVAQAGGVYINAVDLVVIPSEMPKFLEAIKENGANAVKEPGCREFNITVLANNPNHVFLYEVYDNEAALNTHRQTEHFKKYQAATANMIADRNVRAMSLIAFNSKGH
jgi:(4S)-4-hydroxy-5-phosphonooxypentane-2,3-dione isomerase